MTTISEQTKFTLPIVASLLSIVVGGAGWVTYMTLRVEAMHEDIALIKDHLGIGKPHIPGNNTESVAGVLDKNATESN